MTILRNLALGLSLIGVIPHVQGAVTAQVETLFHFNLGTDKGPVGPIEG